MLYNYSTILDEELSQDNPLFWNRPTPVNCLTIRTIGIFEFLAAFCGMILNGALVCSFIRYKELRTPPNIFIMFLSFVGLLATCGMPLSSLSSINCQWLFNRGGCQFEAIVAFLYGCASAYLLCAVSIGRCYIIVRPFNAKDVTVTKCTIYACVALFLASIWTILPLLGWNEYTLESALTSCCVNMHDRRTSYMTYNFVLFIFVYCIPLIILFTTNTIIYLGLKRMRTKLAEGAKTDFSQRRIEMEQRILKSILMTVFGFIFTWTPYSIVFCMSVFRGNDSAVSPLAAYLCACFAKSSVVWIPILYISTSTHFRVSFVNMNAMDKQGQTVTSTGGMPNPSNANRNDDKPTATGSMHRPSIRDFTIIDEH